MFWIYRAYLHEPSVAFENLLATVLPVEKGQVLAGGHLVAGLLQMFLGNLAAGHAHAEESERLFLQVGPSSKADLAHARNVLIYTDVNIANDPIEKRRRHEENLKLFQETDDRWGIAHTIFNIADTLRKTGDLAGARRAHEQSLALFQACGDHIRVVQQKAYLAYIAFEEGKYAEARTNFEEVLSVFRSMHYNLEMDFLLWILGAIAICEGNYVLAKTWYTECLLFDQHLGVNTQLAECLTGFGRIANAEKRFERAAQLVGAAEAQVEARQIPLEKIDRAELERLITILRQELGDEVFDTLVAQGRAMTMEQAIAYALEQDRD
jgi:tetratricopeptide (TPR) repeat protein